MKTKVLAIITLAGVLISGCGEPQTVNIDVINDEGKPVMALDYRDFNQAASEMVQSMISSGSLKKPGGGRYVLTTAKITNDTMQRIDTDQLMAKIEQEIMGSGQVVMTAAVGGRGAPDEMIYEMRDIRDSATGEEFQQDTLAGKGTLQAPELSISGKIIQRNIRYDSSRQQVEYYFQLRLTDLTTGLVYWQNETLIGKRGSNKSVSW
ncbi:MAG: penicillin-binding protein activator LpoB [Sedimentisphaerales bacterium]|nr:penicillin-binding protein activator LpoB [Sedimentisphaerales bacterium]